MNVTTFKKNISITFVTNMINLIIAIISGVITARWLGPSGKGIYSYVTLIPGLFVMFGNFGLGQANTYFIGKKKFKYNNVYGFMINWLFLWATIIIIIFIIIINVVSNIKYQNLIYLITPSIFFKLGSRFFNNLLLISGKATHYNLGVFLNSFLLLFFFVLFVVILDYGVIGTLYAWNIAAMFHFLFVILYSKPKNYKYLIRIDKEWLKDSLKYGSKIYFTNLITFLNYKADRFIIIALLNPAQLGIYSVASALGQKIWLIPEAIATILFPKISNIEVKKANILIYKIVAISFYISLIIGFILVLSGKLVIFMMYGKDFVGAYYPFVFLTLGSIPFSIFKIGAQYLTGTGNQKYLFYITLFSAIINITMNIFLIPQFRILGAGLASFISYFLSGTIVLIILTILSGNKMKEFLNIKILFIQIKSLYKKKNK